MSWDAAQALVSGNVDVAFTYTKPADKRIQVRHIDWLEMAIVAPLFWQERLKNLSLNDLATLPWVWTSEHCPLNTLQQEIFADAGCEPEKAVVVDQEAAILKLVSEGIGLSIMPMVKAIDVALTNEIVPVKKLKKKMGLFLIYLQKRERDQKILALLEVIGRVWKPDVEDS
jgi:DNA-binding transcriptional LysR family regulator